jgi:peptide deformylase
MMALRQIRKDGDDVLRKKSKIVKEITPSVLTLLDDMVETMYEEEGVGLAAPQVGILKRIVVIDVGDGIIELINPEIIEEDGEQVGAEGCLSIPGLSGEVKRPEKVKVKALNRNGDEIVLEGEGLLAVAFCHEIDHLNGILFTDKVIRYINDTNE